MLFLTDNNNFTKTIKNIYINAEIKNKNEDADIELYAEDEDIIEDEKQDSELDDITEDETNDEPIFKNCRVQKIYKKSDKDSNNAQLIYPLLKYNILLECFDYELDYIHYNFPAIILKGIYYKNWVNIFGDYNVEIPSQIGDFIVVIDAESMFIA